MGITGLLPYLKHTMVHKPVKSYANTTIGIDGHSWLYRIATTIAQELFYQLPTNKHVSIFRQKIHGLRTHGIRPVLVFDGDRLPSKDVTTSQRKERKEQVYQTIITCLNNNNTLKANELMKQCLFITDEVLSGILGMLRSEGVEYVISPYESDAQLCYLQRTGYIEYIMTEDSDLIVYGCDKILYKYDGYKVDEFRRERLRTDRDLFFMSNMRGICILSGCDYLHSIKGVGLITAQKLFEKHNCYKKVINHLRSKKEVPEDYEQEFQRALITFDEHIVFDPVGRERVHLSGKKSLAEAGLYEFLGLIAIEDPIGHSKGAHIKKAEGVIESFAVRKYEKRKLPTAVTKKIKTVSSKPVVVDESETSYLFDKD